jgi:membrane fusion protein (multidrug efflux system)
VAPPDDTKVLEVEAELSLSETRLVPAAFRDLTVHKPARRRSSRVAVLLMVLLLVAASAGAYGWYYWTVAQFLESTDDAYAQADSTIVAPKVSGYLRDAQVSDNQPVKAGQMLANSSSFRWCHCSWPGSTRDCWCFRAYAYSP